MARPCKQPFAKKKRRVAMGGVKGAIIPSTTLKTQTMWRNNHTIMEDNHMLNEYRRSMKNKGFPENFLDLITIDVVKTTQQ